MPDVTIRNANFVPNTYSAGGYAINRDEVEDHFIHSRSYYQLFALKSKIAQLQTRRRTNSMGSHMNQCFFQRFQDLNESFFSEISTTSSNSIRMHLGKDVAVLPCINVLLSSKTECRATVLERRFMEFSSNQKKSRSSWECTFNLERSSGIRGIPFHAARDKRRTTAALELFASHVFY